MVPSSLKAWRLCQVLDLLTYERCVCRAGVTEITLKSMKQDSRYQAPLKPQKQKWKEYINVFIYEAEHVGETHTAVVNKCQV